MLPPSPFPLSSAPPAPLVLVSASYDSDAPQTLTLVFDRAVNPMGYIQEAFAVYDAAVTLQWYQPDGMEQPGPATLRFSLVAMEPIGGGFVRMDALEGNGIVAAGDGQPWPGVTNLPLPFP